MLEAGTDMARKAARQSPGHPTNEARKLGKAGLCAPTGSRRHKGKRVEHAAVRWGGFYASGPMPPSIGMARARARPGRQGAPPMHATPDAGLSHTAAAAAPGVEAG